MVSIRSMFSQPRYPSPCPSVRYLFSACVPRRTLQHMTASISHQKVEKLPAATVHHNIHLDHHVVSCLRGHFVANSALLPCSIPCCDMELGEAVYQVVSSQARCREPASRHVLYITLGHVLVCFVFIAWFCCAYDMPMWRIHAQQCHQ